MTRVLVTGGAGFIGSHLVARLVERGDEVVVLDRLERQVHQGTVSSLPQDVTLVQGDVGEIDAVDEALDGVQAIVHLAAAVGVGQSMYEIDHYVRRNTISLFRIAIRGVTTRISPSLVPILMS